MVDLTFPGNTADCEGWKIFCRCCWLIDRDDVLYTGTDKSLQEKSFSGCTTICKPALQFDKFRYMDNHTDMTHLS